MTNAVAKYEVDPCSSLWGNMIRKILLSYILSEKKRTQETHVLKPLCWMGGAFL